jgi:hypothetical protein
MPASKPLNSNRTLFFFFETPLTKHTGPWPRNPEFKGTSCPFLHDQASDRTAAPRHQSTGFFYCASEYTHSALGGVTRADVSVYLYYCTLDGGGLTGRIGRKRHNTLAAARRTPSPGAPLDRGFICASADTLFSCISRSILSIF